VWHAAADAVVVALGDRLCEWIGIDAKVHAKSERLQVESLTFEGKQLLKNPGNWNWKRPNDRHL
jgi:hypothetical protein